MFTRFRRSIGRFFNKSRKVNHEPINKFSQIVIVIIDLFILSSVFAGLNDISQWPLSPYRTYPCHSAWQNYRESTAVDKDYSIVSQSLDFSDLRANTGSYQSYSEGYLGEVSSLCLQYERTENALSTSAAQTITKGINDNQAEIDSFSRMNRDIRQQYDSTLLEEIAGQPREQSINTVDAAQARQEIERNEQKIAERESRLNVLRSTLITTDESQVFLALLNDDSQFAQVDEGYQKASFWYPSIQLVFQAIFLVPLILVAFGGYTVAQRKHYGLVALISWHLLVIFSIPLILKVFEFMQVGVLFNFIFDIIAALFGRLLFLVSYIYILLIPPLGFGIIKLAQRFIFNPKLQAAGRVQKSRCIKCAKKIKAHDSHCPHCGYHQHRECSHCHQVTYQYLPYCKHCGTAQTVAQ